MGSESICQLSTHKFTQSIFTSDCRSIAAPSECYPPYYCCSVTFFLLFNLLKKFSKFVLWRAVWGFCEHLKTSQTTSMLTPMLPIVTESLLNLAILFSHEVLSLVLETLALVLAVSILWVNRRLVTLLLTKHYKLLFRLIRALLRPANLKFVHLLSHFF